MINNIQEFEHYRTLREILTDLGMMTLSEIIRMARFGFYTKRQPSETLEILLGRDLKMLDFYKQIIRIELAERKREMRKKKINLLFNDEIV